MTAVNNHGFKTHYQRINGIYMHYAKAGEGPSLILIHGWANNWVGWIPLARKLKKNFTLYLVDLPGYGDSGRLNNYDVKTCAKYVIRFMDLINIKAKAIIGLSIGCFVVAEIMKLHPEKAEFAVLLGPVIRQKKVRRLFRSALYSLKLFNISRPTKYALKKVLATKIYSYILSKYVNMYKFNKELVDKFGLEGKRKMHIDAFIRLGISAEKYDLRKTLAKLKVPTLLVYGREDKITSINSAIEPLEINNKLNYSIIPEAGHMVHWEQPDEVIKKMEIFLGKKEVN